MLGRILDHVQETQMAKNLRIACSASVVIRRMQISNQGNAVSYLSGWQRLSLMIRSVNEDIEKWALEYSDYGSVNLW